MERMGETFEPCGIPLFTGFMGPRIPSRQTAAWRSDRKAAVHFTNVSGIPNSLIVFSRMLWFTLSKKPEMSNVSGLVTRPWL
ncbi:hypothetical protein C8J55DRAFT_416631 [Lentinula edodes]|uniref:Uncharacterized protein n=1 Tax=Lentinula lateritia TaxID=40482 RepID=A0A9W9B154_9AGAR|nr:hypothetical protein C8J55DRAFT_416631 [Lentinula edodes]